MRHFQSQCVCAFILLITCLIILPIQTIPSNKAKRLKCKFCRNIKVAKSQANILKLLDKPIPEPENSIYNVHLDKASVLGSIDERFISFAVDAIEMKRGWRCFPMESKILHTLISGLSPAYFRIGGTAQDFVTFKGQYDGNLDNIYQEINDISESTTNCTPRFISYKYQTPFVTDMLVFDDILKFSHSVDGIQFIYGLNGRKRNADGSWDATNAELLISHVIKKGYNVWWELGNEPNRYGKYGTEYKVSGSQLAKDFEKLKKIAGKNAITLGPDVTRPKKSSLMYLHDFIRSQPDVHALTYHQYYINQAYARLDDYVNPLLLDNFAKQIRSVLGVIKYANHSTPLWLGETGSSSGGGKKGLSDTYVAGFLYLDKLGLAANHDHKVVIRQSFYGGYYGMLDPVTRDPLPDYWSALLFKQLVGRKVLKTTVTHTHLRVYAFCSKDMSGDIVLLVISLHKKQTVTVNLDTSFGGNDLIQYLLEPGGGDLQSKYVYLNKKLLKLTDDGQLPKLDGELLEQPIRIPPLRYGFYVVRDAKFHLCMSV